MKLKNIIYKIIAIGLYLVIPGVIYKYALYPETFPQRVLSLIVCGTILLLELVLLDTKPRRREKHYIGE